MAPTGFWAGRSVLVTGGSGFIGSFVVEQLVALGARVRVPTRDPSRGARFLSRVRAEVDLFACDLADPGQAKLAVEGASIVLHLAASVGGLEYNLAHPGSIFRDNLTVFMNTLDAARQAGVERFLVTSSACVYPRHALVPTPESEGFRDRPEPSNEGYGFAKRMEEFLGQAYAREFGMKIAIARPYNAYGPRDNFAPDRSHVIPALIRRIFRDRERPLVVWGSGRQSRDFLYVEDFARGLLEVTEHHAVAEPLNLGTDTETPIAELVRVLVAIHREHFGEDVEYHFDVTKPEGQPRRRSDVTRAREVLGWQAKWKLEDGLRETVRWYLAQG